MVAEQPELGLKVEQRSVDLLVENFAMTDNHDDLGLDYSSKVDSPYNYPDPTKVPNSYANLGFARFDPDYPALPHQQLPNAQANLDHWGWPNVLDYTSN